MAELTLAVAASHAPGLTGWFDKAPPPERAVVTGMYAAIRDAIVGADLDLLIIVANDHVNNLRVGDYADFTFGAASRHTGPDEWFKPWLRVDDYDVPGAPDLGTTLYRATQEATLRTRCSTGNLRYDDNVSVPLTMAELTKLELPVLPILQNCTVPPFPDQVQCYEFGRRLGTAVRELLPADLRVGIMGSGGLSHEPGGRRYLEIDEVFDAWFLDLVVEGDHERLLTELTVDRLEAAGSGGTAELLSWVVAMGAIGPRPCTPLGYVAVDEWRCGVGGVQWSMA